VVFEDPVSGPPGVWAPAWESRPFVEEFPGVPPIGSGGRYRVTHACHRRDIPPREQADSETAQVRAVPHPRVRQRVWAGLTDWRSDWGLLLDVPFRFGRSG